MLFGYLGKLKRTGHSRGTGRIVCHLRGLHRAHERYLLSHRANVFRTCEERAYHLIALESFSIAVELRVEARAG